MRAWAGLFITLVLLLIFIPGNLAQPVAVDAQGASTAAPTDQTPRSNPLFIVPGRSKTDTLAVNEQGKQYTLDTAQDSDFILTLHDGSRDPLAFGLVVTDTAHQNDGPYAAGSVSLDNPSTVIYVPGIKAGGQIFLQVNEPDHTDPLPFQVASYYITPRQMKQGDTVRGNLTATVPFQSYQFPGSPKDVVTVVAQETRTNGGFLWLTHLVDQVTPANTVDLSNQPIPGRGVYYLYLVQDGDFHLLVGAIGPYSIQVIHNDIQPLTAGPQQTTLSNQNPTTIWQVDPQADQPMYLKGQLISGGGAIIRVLQFDQNTRQFDDLTDLALSDQAVQLAKQLPVQRASPIYILAQIPPAYFRDQVTVAVTVSNSDPNAAQ